MTLDPALPELSVISDFLLQCSPFDTLPAALLSQIAKRIQIVYYRKGSSLEVESADDGLRIIRQGAAELRGAQQQLLDVLGEGESFNLAGLNAEKSAVKATFIEDSLVYFLPHADYRGIREQHRGFDRFFHSQRSRRLRRAARYQPQPAMMMQPVRQLLAGSALSVAPSTTLQDAARFMSEHRISSVLVIGEGELVGIVTDRDLRSRALAKGLPLNTSISEVMTPEPFCVAADATVFDATLLMTQRGSHHLPVIDGRDVVGVITASDLMLARQDDPVYLVQHISRQRDVSGMQQIVKSLPNLLVEWISAGIRAGQVSRILTAISDAITQRLIALAIEELGMPPASFCWLGFGSQARSEQLLGADQDNGLLIDDSASDGDLNWFKQLAIRVCDGLNACGYPYCNGKVMATTEQWRQPLRGWQHTVDQWMNAPTPDAVMRVSIFFDLRCIYGDESLTKKLQAYMLQRSSANSIFLAALAENVLANSPPLGLFRRFLVERNGEHRDSFDLKKRGVLPIIDLVRIHALAHQLSAVNTRERIDALAKAGVMTMTDSRNLQDAFELIMQLRIQNQAAQVSKGQTVDNFCNPEQLTELKRKQLRDAFTVVHEAQESIRRHFRAGMG